MSRHLGYALLITCWFAWGFAYPATKISLETLDVWSSRALAMFGGGVILLALAAAQGRALRVPRPLWRDLGIAALCNMTVFQIGMTIGVYYFSAGRTAVIVYTMPLWAAVFAVWLLRERLTPARLAALALGLAGIAVLMSQDFPHLRNAPGGALATLVAAISFGLGTVWMKRRGWHLDPTVSAGWQLIIGGLSVAAIWLAVGPPVVLGEVSPASWSAILYLMLIANAFAYFAWFRVVAFFSAITSGIGTFAVPVVAVLASAVLVNETVGWRELTALGLIGLALALNVFFPARGERS